jgi:hypothetical protein
MNNFQAAIMKVVDRLCSTESGYCTSEIADLVGRQPGRDSNRRHSAYVLQELFALEAVGRVRRLDDKLPIVWCKGA